MNNHEACYQHDVITKFEALISEVRSGQKLGDDHVNAANQLLKSQFENLQGLSIPRVYLLIGLTGCWGMQDIIRYYTQDQTTG